MSVEVLRNVINPFVIDRALRHIHEDVMNRGLAVETLGTYIHSMSWFPHLRWDKQITQLADCGIAPPKSIMCDPQILLQFPHTGPEPEITMHVDELPPWGGRGAEYALVAGVPLSKWTDHTGSPIFEDEFNVWHQYHMSPGDLVLFSGDQPHSPGINRSGEIRYGVYFRWLT